MSTADLINEQTTLEQLATLVCTALSERDISSPRSFDDVQPLGALDKLRKRPAAHEL